MASNTNSIQFTKASSQYLTVPENASFAPSSYTMESWVKSTSYTYGGIMGKDISGTRQFFFYVDQTTHQIVIEHAGVVVANSTGSITNDSAWHHIAVVYNGSGTALQAMYLDAGTIAFTAGSSFLNLADANIPLNIGRRAFVGAEQYFDGLIDEVRFWNVQRTSTQIANNWKSDVTGQTGLVAFWKFNEGSGTTTADATGNGNTATFVNSPTWSTDVPFSTYGAASGFMTTNKGYWGT